VYTGAACSPADLAEEVTALIGRDPFTRDGELVIQVAVESDPWEARVRATVEIPGARVRTRRLEAGSCGELAEALAFVIVMALAEPGGKRTGALRDQGSEAPRAAAPAPRPIHLDALAGGAASVALQLEAYLGARVRRRWMSVALELAAALPDSFAAGMGQVTIGRAAATLAPCAHRGSFAGCAALTAGVFRGRGEGFAMSRSEVMPMAMAGARAAWERAITGRLRLHAHGEVGIVLTRNRFFVDDAVVWSTQRVEGRLGIALLVRVP
jgi:hypothetical protein